MSRLVTLAIFLLIVTLVAALGGQFTGAEWYQLMHQPPWNPPAIVMALAWAIFFLLMAVSAWLAWESRRGEAVGLLAIWSLSLLFCILWPWIFFGQHRLGWAMAAMALWVLVSLATAWTSRSLQATAAKLLLLASVWLAFMLGLNFSQWSLNGGGLTTVF